MSPSSSRSAEVSVLALAYGNGVDSSFSAPSLAKRRTVTPGALYPAVATAAASPGAASPAYRVQGESSIGVTGPGVKVPSPAPIATNTDGASSPITRSGRPSPVTSATAIATT